MGRAADLAGRALGCLAGGVTSFLWISAIWFPTDGLLLSGAYLLPISVLMAIGALVGAIASYHGHVKVLLVVFIASFFPVGLVLLDAEHFLRYAGTLNIVTGCSAGLIALGKSLESTT